MYAAKYLGKILMRKSKHKLATCMLLAGVSVHEHWVIPVKAIRVGVRLKKTSYMTDVELWEKTDVQEVVSSNPSTGFGIDIFSH